MKATLRLFLSAAVVLTLAVVNVSAQNEGSDPGSGEPGSGEQDGAPSTDPATGQDAAQNRVGEVVAPPSSDSGVGPLPITPPSNLERPGIPARILERLREFERVREAYLANQLELIRQLRNASEVDRERLREMIQAQRQDWHDQAQLIRERARERLQEMIDQLPQHREAMEAAREQARERLQDAKDQARERRRDGLD